jgi:hypothetical protein
MVSDCGMNYPISIPGNWEDFLFACMLHVSSVKNVVPV